MAAHSLIGASGAHRWMVCPGSVELARKAPPKKDSVYALEGRVAHKVAELALERNQPLELFLGQLIEEVEVTEEMLEAVAVYLDTITRLAAEDKFIRLSEIKLDLSSIYPGLYGTVDFALVSSNMKRLIVIDYKHGKGVPVEVEGNKQILYYILGVIEHCYKKKMIDDPALFGWGAGFQEITAVVVQPRCRHKDGPVRTWSVDPNELDAFADELKAAAILTEQRNAPLQAGDHCKFCPAMAICPAFSKQIEDIAGQDFAVLAVEPKPELPRPLDLSKAQLVKVLKLHDLISTWLDSVHEYAHGLAESGESIPGFKLVKKKANRKWIGNEEKVAAELGVFLSDEQIWEKKLISPAAAEKLIGKKNKPIIEPLYEIPDTGTVLAPDHDPRPAVGNTAVLDFK